MLSALRSRLGAAGGQGGFTLIEMLVVMLAGMVILAALMGLLEVTMRQTTRTVSQVSANQNARIVVERLEDDLHSACLSAGFGPVQAGSDASDLIFVDQEISSTSPANAATPTPVEHKISLSGGSLTDTTYAVTGGSAPNWTFSSTATATTTLATGIAATGSTPIFQYFNFSEPMNGGSPYTDGAGNAYMMIQDGINYVPGTSVKPAAAPLPVPLSSSDAVSTVEILLTLSAAPNGGSGTESQYTAPIQSQLSLRLTPPANHIGDSATFTPCA